MRESRRHPAAGTSRFAGEAVGMGGRAAAAGDVVAAAVSAAVGIEKIAAENEAGMSIDFENHPG